MSLRKEDQPQYLGKGLVGTESSHRQLGTKLHAQNLDALPGYLQSIRPGQRDRLVIMLERPEDERHHRELKRLFGSPVTAHDVFNAEKQKKLVDSGH